MRISAVAKLARPIFRTFLWVGNAESVLRGAVIVGLALLVAGGALWGLIVLVPPPAQIVIALGIFSLALVGLRYIWDGLPALGRRGWSTRALWLGGYPENLMLVLTPPKNEPIDSTMGCRVIGPDGEAEVDVGPGRGVRPPGSSVAYGTPNEFYFVSYPNGFPKVPKGRPKDGSYTAVWTTTKDRPGVGIVRRGHFRIKNGRLV